MSLRPLHWMAALVLGGCACEGAELGGDRMPTPAAERQVQESVLHEKAQYFDRIIHQRHFSASGLFLYVVDLDRIHTQLHAGSVPALADTPTYTGLFAATSCLRARLESGTLRRAAQADAARALEGLSLLMAVTGRPGLLARGIQRAPMPPRERRKPSHRWFPGAPPHDDLVWRGDASQDQYANGLLPAIAACHQLFPERTRQLARAAATLLERTDMQLVDPDGRRTRYGDLSPQSGLGFNAIARLTGYGIFALAASLDPDPRWSAEQQRLRDQERVVATSSRTNLRILGITNYSNDLMAWNLYRALVPLARRAADPALPDLAFGLRKASLRVAPDANPYFTLVECAVTGSCPLDELEAARQFLIRFPREKRRLAPSAELAEIPRRWIPGRKGRIRARQLVPIELRPPDNFEWKANPYRVTGVTAPQMEYTGLDYLCAYWVYRWVTEARSTAAFEEDYI